MEEEAPLAAPQAGSSRAAVATAGPSSSTAFGQMGNQWKSHLYQVLRNLFLANGVSSVKLAEVVQAYNATTQPHCTAEAVDQVSVLCTCPQ